ncbi:MAG: adenylosuccinate lyase, partial [Culicoidibacterales bacterium]
SLGLIFSQRVMLTLINEGWARERAYDTVQPLAMQAWENQVPFQHLVQTNEAIAVTLTVEQIADCFDPTYHVKNVDAIFARLGLAE